MFVFFITFLYSSSITDLFFVLGCKYMFFSILSVFLCFIGLFEVVCLVILFFGLSFICTCFLGSFHAISSRFLYLLLFGLFVKLFNLLAIFILTFVLFYGLFLILILLHFPYTAFRNCQQSNVIDLLFKFESILILSQNYSPISIFTSDFQSIHSVIVSMSISNFQLLVLFYSLSMLLYSLIILISEFSPTFD